MGKINFKHYLLDPDGTEKFVFNDGIGVLEITRINTKEDRDIYCVPSMYECRLGCTICYLTINNIVGSNKKIKSSTVLQCLDFIDIVKPSYKKGKQISIMGVGEPLLNIEMIEELCQNERIDRVSIASIFPFIPKELPKKLKIHYSLHNPIQEKRLKMIPNGKENFDNVLNYLKNHKGDVEIHYTLVENENDTDEELNEIINKLKNNNKYTIKFLDFKTSYKTKLAKSNKLIKWIKELEKNGISTEFYYPPGEQIQGSCGLFTEGFYSDNHGDDFKVYLSKYEVKLWGEN